MNDEYLTAPRSAMVIRIVEPAYFETRIVDECRPLSPIPTFEASNYKKHRCLAILGFAGCLAMLFVIGAIATTALDAFLSGL